MDRGGIEGVEDFMKSKRFEKAEKPRRLTDRRSRIIARNQRDQQWKFMERVACEGVVWMCPWDKYRKHGRRCPVKYCESASFSACSGGWQCARCKTVMDRIPDDGVHVFGLLGCNELLSWIESHKDWWKRGYWSPMRCARSIRITEAGLVALKNKHLYDDEDIHGGFVGSGYLVRPWPRRKPA